MKLPKMPYSKKKSSIQTTSFRGLNLAEGAQDGELSDSLGLSATRYPYISQRDGRETLEGYSNPTDIFEWDGKLIVIDGTELFYDGDKVATVMPGKKQFAVVNTKLCVFPDKIFYDVNTGETGYIDGGVSSAMSFYPDDPVVNVTSKTIAVAERGLSTSYALSRLTSTGWIFIYRKLSVFYTYGTDYKAVENCWDASNSVWDMEKLALLERETTYDTFKSGMIVILNKSNKVVKDGDSNCQSKEYGTDGKYAVAMFIGRNENGDQDISYGHNLYGTVYQVNSGSHTFSGVFKDGDVINITGSVGGIYDTQNALLSSVEDYKLTFKDDVFQVMSEGENIVEKVWCAVDADPLGKNPNADPYVGVIIRIEEVLSGHSKYKGFFIVTPDTKITKGRYSYFITGISSPVYLFDKNTRQVVETCKTIYDTGDRYSDFSAYHTTHGRGGDFTIVKHTDSRPVHFSKPYPELDFVCESGNRLWGVSNKDNSVYASVFGDPTNFYLYDPDNDESGYALTFGSEGDFTGICAYGGGICCWKERRMHKVLGVIPSEYYSTEYEIPGVQKGSERSLQVVNETLFYKGTNGVYAYNGGVPSLISYNLGKRKLTDAVGGYDGQRYYLNALDGLGEPQMLTYDLTHGIWLKEDLIRAEAFTTTDEAMHFLSEGVIYKTGQENGERIAWLAEFAPFTEAQHLKKGYSKLMLRLDMEAGSYIKIETKTDRKPWSKVYSRGATNDMTLNIPLRMGRCDQFALRLSGEGRVVIRSMVRELSVWSGV